MIKIVYVLLGIAVAAVIVTVFAARIPVDAVGIEATLVFVALMAIAFGVLIYSRWGQRTRSRIDDNLHAADDRLRQDARDKGEVRRPPNLYP